MSDRRISGCVRTCCIAIIDLLEVDPPAYTGDGMNILIPYFEPSMEQTRKTPRSERLSLHGPTSAAEVVCITEDSGGSFGLFTG